MIDGVAHKNITQGKKFYLCLRFTNLSEISTEEFTISEINIASADGKSFEDNFSKKVCIVKSLAPKEVFLLCIGENGVFLTGLLVVELKFIIKEGVFFEFLQKNPFTQTFFIPSKDGKFNYWCDFLYADSIRDVLQDRTNNLIKWLTIVTTILAVIQAAPILYKYFFTI